MREKKKKEYFRLLHDATKALFVLSDEQFRRFNWYYQELYYIKLVSFLDDTLNYVQHRPKLIENSAMFDAWMARLLKGREQIYDVLSQDELLYVHYRRVRAAHLFQDAYEYDDEEKKNLGKPVHIIQRDGEKKDYSRWEAEDTINRFHQTCGYTNSKDLDMYFVRKLEPVLTKMRHELNAILYQHNQIQQCQLTTKKK